MPHRRLAAVLRHRSGVRLTLRGKVMAGCGVLLAGTGVAVGSRSVVQVGALLLAAVLTGLLVLLVEVWGQEAGRVRMVRHVAPHPVTVGEQAVVDIEVTRTGRQRLDRLLIAERAARELSGGGALRARVRRSQDRLRLSYAITPERRGRWATGPLEVQRRDIFDVAMWRGPLGEPTRVAVRPKVVPLDAGLGGASAEQDRGTAGVRNPSPDDAALRDYQTGDDLRRVHWRSSARRGALVVRQDERAGRRPASVVLDLPVDDAEAEWTITAGASIAVALARSGRHTRLLGGDVLGGLRDHHRPDGDGLAVDALLDQTVDLTRPHDESTRSAWLAAAVETVTAQGGGAELVYLVVGALDADGLAGLARLGAACQGWAMVRRGHDHPRDAPGSGHRASSSRGGGRDDPRPTAVGWEQTLSSLRRAGWVACAVDPGEDVASAWQRLVESDDRARPAS